MVNLGYSTEYEIPSIVKQKTMTESISLGRFVAFPIKGKHILFDSNTFAIYTIPIELFHLLNERDEAFVQDLSYCVGEVKEFINKDNEFSGWPLLNLPIHRRPFIAIDGRYYCFDYYSLSDSFYRALQRAVTMHTDVDVWKEKQKLGSEKCVEALFHKLLPESQIYRNI